MDQQIKAVFLDIDGTLVSHKLRSLPDSTIGALNRLHEQGILVFISTGRHALELGVLPEDAFRFDGYSVLNGQLCLDADRRPFYASPVTEEDRQALVELYESGDVPVILVTEEDFYINFVNDAVCEVLKVIPGVAPGRKEIFPGGDLLMGIVFCPRDLDEPISRRIGGLRMARWHDLGADLVPQDAGKVRGVQQFMKHYGLMPDEVMAFGDEENDIGMLTYAGIGIAMGNARETVKAAADYVTSPVDEDGVCSALIHFGLV